MGTQKAVPFTRLPIQMILKKYGVRWFVWFSTKGHVSFLRCIVSFFCIAFFAGCYKIHPRVSPTLCPRHYVVNCEIAPGTAVLAFEIVALKNILPGKINALVGGVYISIQPYNRWHRKALRYRMQPVAVGRPDEFTLLKKDQNKGAFH